MQQHLPVPNVSVPIGWPDEDEPITHPLQEIALRGWHAVSSRARWDLDKLVVDLRDSLVYSHARDGTRYPAAYKRAWRRLLLRLEENGGEPTAFVALYLREEYCRLTVWAPTPEAAETRFLTLRDRYGRGPRRERAKAQFHILTISPHTVDTHPVDVIKSFARNEEELALHYGAEFPDWEKGFLEKLRSTPSGVSILRGEPGTGKTSFIRHLLYRLGRTHRFYYLPIAFYHLLSSPQMVEFWVQENRDHANKTKVIILEDAESLLVERGGDNRDRLADMLNISDGLLGEFLKLHVICTINCRIDRLDPALTRPGRLVAYRDFRRLSPEEAIALARANRLAWTPDPAARDFSLAEVYNGANVAEPTAAAAGAGGRAVGFGA